MSLLRAVALMVVLTTGGSLNVTDCCCSCGDGPAGAHSYGVITASAANRDGADAVRTIRLTAYAPEAAKTAPAPILMAPATLADQSLINAQRVCPVSGKGLGSMGAPIKLMRGNQSVLVCCKGCVKTVTADPNKDFRSPSETPKTR